MPEKTKSGSQEKLDSKQVEKQVAEAKQVIQNSAIGRKLPKKVKNLHTEDLLKFAAIVKLTYFFPMFVSCYLVCISKSENIILRSLSSVATWIVYIAFVDFTNYFIYFTEMIDLMLVCYISTGIKTGVNVLYLLAIFFTLHGVIAKTLVVFTLLSSVYVDTVFLLYLDIYFKEIRGEKAGALGNEDV